jgi:predicted RNA-binding Zn-ribbon protein involved in translation (DUF1610 family)
MDNPLCPICQCIISPAEEKVTCPDCHTQFHQECWESNHGCAVYGCPQVPPTEKRSELEVPVSFWGRESKPCPSCGEEILAAAVRCRLCGATFSSPRPLSEAEFQQQEQLESDLPALRKGAVLIFIFGCLTCTAPAAGLIGLFWLIKHRKELGSLPAIYHALTVLGVVVGLGQSVLIIIMSALFAEYRA